MFKENTQICFFAETTWLLESGYKTQIIMQVIWLYYEEAPKA